MVSPACNAANAACHPSLDRGCWIPNEILVIAFYFLSRLYISFFDVQLRRPSSKCHLQDTYHAGHIKQRYDGFRTLYNMPSHRRLRDREIIEGR